MSVECHGFLESDNSIRECMVDASNQRMPYALRRLFATILVFGEPTDVRDVCFNTIMNVIKHKKSVVFFVDGPGGTGKTFLYRAIMAVLRSRGDIILATASSGIAVTLLAGGRTAHSQFRIPF
ncbi:PIF1-like helicase [Medicago truncatula]|uniref:ATP-dependent DNA helicase n=1 Tax=Medicago truncatula TaxID=3880 RepID=A0A072UQ43_MEDTR|nr:PIF1-like helicase [Medicago truncatula]